MDDRECVLRFLAFSIVSPDDYSKDDFDKFLNDCMETMNTMPPYKLEELKHSFFTALETAEKIFANDAFRKRYDKESSRYPINKALFESWCVNLAGLNDNERNKLVERKEQLIEKNIFLLSNDKEFEMSISQGTGSVKRVRMRFSKIRRLIQEVLDA